MPRIAKVTETVTMQLQITMVKVRKLWGDVWEWVRNTD
jgi:hypothetical protein